MVAGTAPIRLMYLSGPVASSLDEGQHLLEILGTFLGLLGGPSWYVHPAR